MTGENFHRGKVTKYFPRIFFPDKVFPDKVRDTIIMKKPFLVLFTVIVSQGLPLTTAILQNISKNISKIFIKVEHLHRIIIF